MTLNEFAKAERVIAADMIHHPNHYMKAGHECKDIIKIIVHGLSGFEAYCVGNIVKYIWRFPKKNGLEDLQKAREYIDMLIDARKGSYDKL